jgi:hypothetical protein
MSIYPKDLGDNRWVIEVKNQSGSNELYIDLPPSALNQMGWDMGDIIVWIEQDDKSIVLTKKENDEQN